MRLLSMLIGTSVRRGFSSFSFPKQNLLDKRKYIPRRAVMYVPGNDNRKIAKIPSLSADCVVLDCEDGVAISKKAEARENIRRILDSAEEKGKLFPESSGTECTVRVNSVQSSLLEEDLKEILPAKNLPSSIHLPKVDSAEEVTFFFEKSAGILKSSGGGGGESERLGLILFIESAQGMLNLPGICEKAWALSERVGYFTPAALVFGSDDYCADIGAQRSKEGGELLQARQYLVMVAKAFKLQAVDIVYIDYKDTEGLKSQCLEGARMGFTGKQLIHPSQVKICQDAFSPSPEKVEWARELVKEFNLHQAKGKGAFTFRGAMIDMPLLLQAKNLLELAERIK